VSVTSFTGSGVTLTGFMSSGALPNASQFTRAALD